MFYYNIISTFATWMYLVYFLSCIHIKGTKIKILGDVFFLFQVGGLDYCFLFLQILILPMPLLRAPK